MVIICLCEILPNGWFLTCVYSFGCKSRKTVSGCLFDIDVFMEDFMMRGIVLSPFLSALIIYSLAVLLGGVPGAHAAMM